MSLEILLRMRPSGVVSKKAMGARSRRLRMPECRTRDADTQPNATPNAPTNSVVTAQEEGHETLEFMYT
jgi:hypothetical protein